MLSVLVARLTRAVGSSTHHAQMLCTPQSHAINQLGRTVGPLTDSRPARAVSYPAVAVRVFGRNSFSCRAWSARGQVDAPAPVAGHEPSRAAARVFKRLATPPRVTGLASFLGFALFRSHEVLVAVLLPQPFVPAVFR